ncbi:hypothetical protein Tco_0990118 [Tanacetum coccineum]|uniref:Uncharacterized protein n=1 Tax=Tanacetum coccineum TaxID=301880 RepID=A0ABQ5EW13_9ASTR
MESKDKVSISLSNDEIKLQMLRHMKGICNKNLQELKKVILVLQQGVLFGNENELAFKTYLTELRKQCEAVLTDRNPKSLDSSRFKHYLQVFHEYAKHDIKSIKNMLISYLNAIEKEIVERPHHEGELRIKERDVKEKREKLEMQKQETMIQKGECISPGDDTDAKREKQVKEKYIMQFRLLYTHIEFLSGIDSDHPCSSGEFQRAFGLFFGETVEYFVPRMFFNLDKLEKQLHDEEFDEKISMNDDESLANSFFTAYARCDAQTFRNILISQMNFVENAIDERGLYKRTHDRKVNERTIQTQKGMVNIVKDNYHVGLVVTESNGTNIENQDKRSKISRAEGADIRLSNDTKPVNKVQSTVEYNVFANDSHHAEQPKFINEGKVDQDVEQCLDKPPLLASVIKNKTTESVNQILESENACLKKTIAQESEENNCENAKCELRTKIVELEKGLTQKTKDFDDVKLKLSNRTAKFEAYFEKLENTKVVLERQLARKIDDSKAEKGHFLKEINHLRTQLENLKGKFVETKFDKPLILGKPPADKLLINSKISNSWFTLKVVV